MPSYYVLALLMCTGYKRLNLPNIWCLRISKWKPHPYKWSYVLCLGKNPFTISKNNLLYKDLNQKVIGSMLFKSIKSIIYKIL